MEDEKQEQETKKVSDSDRGLATRTADYKETYRRTRDHRAAIRRYCAGNVHLMENARAVGNLD